MRPRLYHIDYKVEQSTLDWLRPEDGTPSVSSLVLPRWDEDFHANVLCVGRESLKGQCFDYPPKSVHSRQPPTKKDIRADMSCCSTVNDSHRLLCLAANMTGIATSMLHCTPSIVGHQASRSSTHRLCSLLTLSTAKSTLVVLHDNFSLSSTACVHNCRFITADEPEWWSSDHQDSTMIIW